MKILMCSLNTVKFAKRIKEIDYIINVLDTYELFLDRKVTSQFEKFKQPDALWQPIGRNLCMHEQSLTHWTFQLSVRHC